MHPPAEACGTRSGKGAGAGAVGWEGLEPSTNALKGRCSTIELPTHRTPYGASHSCAQRLGSVLDSEPPLVTQGNLRARVPMLMHSLPPQHASARLPRGATNSIHPTFHHCLRLVALTALLLLGACNRSPQSAHPDLTSPRLALEALGSPKPLFHTAAAQPWLLKEHPALLSAENKDPLSPRNRAFQQALQNPGLFRQLDREVRFEALLLTGDVGECKPLLEHLQKSPDWHLAYVDHTSFIFQRSARASWNASEPDSLASHFEKKSDQATALALCAQKLLALKMNEAAKTRLERATELDSKCADAWNGFARYHLAIGHWEKALTSVERALENDPDSLAALATKAQILFTASRFADAYECSKKLIEARPDDSFLLFYHAKIAHQSHAYQSEIAALEKLISLAEANQATTSGYRIYLAQAYAARSEAAPAIAQLERALADPDLSAEQRSFCEELLGQIKKRSRR